MTDTPKWLYTLLASPFGPAALIFRKAPFAIIEVLLPRGTDAELAKALGAYGAIREGAHPNAHVVADTILRYFKGQPIGCPWQWLEMDSLTSLQQAVLFATAEVPYGQLRSYGQIAAAVNRPLAYRFVGSTMARNPFPILIPCHRVIRSDRSYGEFGGGADLKRGMIEREAEFASLRRQSSVGSESGIAEFS